MWFSHIGSRLLPPDRRASGAEGNRGMLGAFVVALAWGQTGGRPPHSHFGQAPGCAHVASDLSEACFRRYWNRSLQVLLIILFSIFSPRNLRNDLLVATFEYSNIWQHFQSNFIIQICSSISCLVQIYFATLHLLILSNLIFVFR